MLDGERPAPRIETLFVHRDFKFLSVGTQQRIGLFDKKNVYPISYFIYNQRSRKIKGYIDFFKYLTRCALIHNFFSYLKIIQYIVLG